jgi:hypothetical protein
MFEPRSINSPNFNPILQVNLTEQEIRWLCIKSREIFTVQPVLLELEAPIKICGNDLDNLSKHMDCLILGPFSLIFLIFSYFFPFFLLDVDVDDDDDD